MSLRTVRPSSTRAAAPTAMILAAIAAAFPASALAAERTANATLAATSRVQDVIDTLRPRMAIESPVTVAIVPENPLMVSVEPDAVRRAFTLSFEGRFLDALTNDELQAVVAHELGHVWIFTHHPYLQTEELANQVAMRVVSRATLEQVYEKVWAHGGVKGTIARFPDQVVPATAELR
jgi:hypothetical protein